MNDKAIVEFLTRRLSDWKASRQSLVEVWADAWAEFCATPAAYEWQRKSGLFIKPRKEEQGQGDAENDWKHRVHTGKVFELVETMYSYLKRATFSTSAWFKVTARNKEDKQQARIIQKTMLCMLKDSKFRFYFGQWLRQLLVTGTSTYRVTWCNKKKCFKHIVIGNHRVYLNPASNILESDVFVATTVTRAWLTANMTKYNKLTKPILNKLMADGSTEKSDEDNQAKFMEVAVVQSPFDELTLYEYWGTVFSEYDYIGDECYCVMVNDKLIHFDKSKEKEVVPCSFIQLINQSYGISPTTSSLGLIYADRSFLNSRLDNLAVLINSVVGYVEDAVIDPDFKYFPGAKIAVREKDAVFPISNGASQFPLSYQEEGSLDSRINRNVGTIPTIGAGAVRKAERVTAEEINASRQVGGTRINEYYQDMEDTWINAMLSMQYKMLAKYATTKFTDVYRNSDMEGSEEYETLEVIPSQLCCINVRFAINGSEAVLTEENELSKIKEFAVFMSGNEILAQKVNWDEVAQRIADMSGFEDPESLLAVATPSQPEEAVPVAPEQPEVVPGLQIPTASQQNAIQANVAADGGSSLINNLVKGASIDDRAVD